MKQYVTIDKRSKKAQKEYYSKQRGTWGVLNPMTRSVPSGKTYNRNKDKQKNRKIGREFSDGFDADFICHGNEENGRYACINGHLTTADQSEIRKAYLVSVIIKKVLNGLK